MTPLPLVGRSASFASRVGVVQLTASDARGQKPRTRPLPSRGGCRPSVPPSSGVHRTQPLNRYSAAILTRAVRPEGRQARRAPFRQASLSPEAPARRVRARFAAGAECRARGPWRSARSSEPRCRSQRRCPARNPARAARKEDRRRSDKCAGRGHRRRCPIAPTFHSASPSSARCRSRVADRRRRRSKDAQR